MDEIVQNDKGNLSLLGEQLNTRNSRNGSKQFNILLLFAEVLVM